MQTQEAYFAAHPGHRWMEPAFALAAAAAAHGGLLAVEGRCASGKSTLGRALGEVFGCPVFRLDDFFLTPDLRTPERYAQPGGNVDYERFAREVAQPFLAGESVQLRAFDCHEMAMKPAVTVPAAPFAVAEGCYSMHPALRRYFAGALFLTHSPACQRARLLARGGEEMLANFERRWIPLEERYFAACRPQDACALTLDTTDLF